MKRLYYIDFLKALGLAGIIVAHVQAPDWAIMIRNFDVPLMVIISSYLAAHSYDKYAGSIKETIKYLWLRFKRLVFPTWIFLLLYFGLQAILDHGFYDSEYYAYSFALTRYGISFVWVILIYLYSALLVPVFKKIGTSKVAILILAGLYIVYELCYYHGIGVDNKIIDTTFYYIIPYGILTFLGYNYRRMSERTKRWIIVWSGILFAVLAVYFTLINGGVFQIVQIAKYPPRIYYLSFGVFVSFLLMTVLEKYDLRLFKNKIIGFISAHSMWIYLWHILVIFVYEKLHLPENWVLKYIVVFTGAVVVTLVVNKILDVIEKRMKLKVIKYLR